MNELIAALTAKAGITEDQAAKAVEAIKDFVKEKFPMMAGAVDNLFGGAATTTAATDTTATPAASENIMDKISNVIPGEAGQKAEAFVKESAAKVDEVFDGLKDKFSGLFGGK